MSKAIVERKKEKINNNNHLRTNFESEVRITKEKISSVTQGKEYYKERTDTLAANREEAEAELKSYVDNQADALEQLSVMETSEKEAADALASLEKEITEKEIQLNEQNDTIMDSINVSSKIVVEQQKAKSMLEQNNLRKVELNQKILSNKSQVSAATEEMEREKTALDTARKELDNEYVARKSLLASAEKERNHIQKLQQKQQDIQRQYHVESSKLDTL